MNILNITDDSLSAAADKLGFLRGAPGPSLLICRNEAQAELARRAAQRMGIKDLEIEVHRSADATVSL